MKILDVALSSQLAQLLDAGNNRCIRNASTALANHAHLLPPDTHYVEGVWLIGGQTGGHAWLESANTVIDPTLLGNPPYDWDGVTDVPRVRVKSYSLACVQAHILKSDKAGEGLSIVTEDDDLEAARQTLDPDPSLSN